MAKEPTFGHGKICYLQIPAKDIQRSAEFYEKVFDWHIRRNNEGNVAFDDSISEVSGTWVLDRQPTSNPGVLVHIMVNNAAKTAEAIVQHGGTIVKAVNANPPVTAEFLDPAGNLFGIYEHQG